MRRRIHSDAKRILFLPHIFPIMGGGDDRQDMWCRREANVKLADTVRIMPYSAAIPAHEVRERCIRAMDGEYAPVADGDCNADKIRTAS